MNRFVASPHWDNWMIVSYFFLGGIAAGCAFIAALLELTAREESPRATRVCHYLAFPLIALCGVLLIVDLQYPARFWHLMIRSEQVPMPIVKPWSPISIGSWGVLVFSLFSFFNFAAVLAEDGRLGPLRGVLTAVRRGILGVLFRVGTALSALFLAGYTGALLTASNQPVWSDTTTISGLFLASAVSTGIAAMLLGHRFTRAPVGEEVRERLEAAETWAMALELAMLVAFFVTLGSVAGVLFRVWTGWAILLGVVVLGILAPLALRRRPSGGDRSQGLAAGLVLLGGLVLRIAVVGSAPAVLGLGAP